MTPIRIEFSLTSAVVDPAYPIHLDALLAWSAVDQAIEDGATNPIDAQHCLPLERRDDVWCASALLFDFKSPPHTVALTKRTDPLVFSDALYCGHLKSAPNKLNLSSGPWRQALYFNQCRAAASATAFCIGDLELVTALVRRLRYIGAKRRHGRGRIRHIDVVADAEAETRWRERILPHEEAGYFPIQAVTSPPYWDRSRAVSAWAHPNIV